ncbi:MAG: WecB/TagA/CpsF family glycosyltransferase, partial [Clostridiales bacterium]|nr:WecB/TagA/CpsF family glycosyltransferase [Clostridiales bacterium]
MADIQIVDVLGFPVANVDMAETVAAAAALLEPRANAEQAPGAIDASGSDATAADRSAACGARIVTANAEILYHSYSDPALGELLRGADLLVPDGIGVVKAAAMLGSPVKERVAGADLLVELSAWAADNGRSVYLLGASPESVEGAASALQEKYPALSIAGYHDGYFNEEEREDVLRDIQSKRPDFLFIGMGFPAQDIFFTRHQDRLPVGLMVGVGG